MITITERVVNLALQKLQNIENDLPGESYRYISRVLAGVKSELANDGYFIKQTDPEQSWKPVLGNALEALVQPLIDSAVRPLGLRCQKPTKKELGGLYEAARKEIKVFLDKEKRKIAIPDSDLIIYRVDTFQVYAIVSIKKKFRERIAQVGYWTIKIRNSKKAVKSYLVTLDEDKELSKPLNELGEKSGQGRDIAYVDTNGTYVLSEQDIVEEGTIKNFDKLVEDIKFLVGNPL